MIVDESFFLTVSHGSKADVSRLLKKDPKIAGK